MRLRNLISWSAKLQLYKSNILQHLTYCDVEWHFCKSSDKRKMEGIRLVTGAGLYQQRLKHIDILTNNG